MKCRSKKATLIALAIASVIAPAGAFAQAEQVVLIGNAGPLTGGAAHWGKDNENGARLAIEDLNKKGLVIGGKKVRFELVSQDDQADPRHAMLVANKLVDTGVKGVLGHFNSGAAIPASSIYSRAGIPDISVATNPQLTQQGLKNTFRIIASDDDVGAALAQFAVKELKASKVAVIDDRTAYGQGAASVFAKAVKAQGATIVSEQFSSDRATDFMAILTTIKSKQPDIIFYGGMDAQAGLIARQMKQLGIKAKLLGTDGLCTSEVAKISAGAVDGMLYCTRGGKELDKMPRGAEFEKRYKGRFNTEVLSYAPYLYDSMMTLAAAMQAANSVEPAQYLSAVAKVDYEGITGTIRFDEKGNLKQPGFTVFTYQSSKRVRVAGS